LRSTAKYISTRGKGILASDESNATTGKRLESVGVDNSEDNRRDWRELLYTAPGRGGKGTLGGGSKGRGGGARGWGEGGREGAAGV
jgi:fructose-bisphosphate aldolase class 1